MRGLDRIEEMRRNGFRPGHVALTDTPPMPDVLDDVQYELADIPELQDLRALVGLFVIVDGANPELVERWAQAAEKAKARAVLVVGDWL